MPEKSRSISDGVVSYDHSAKYAVLFGTLILALTVPSFVPLGFVRYYVVPVFVTLVLLSALAAVSDDRWTFRIGLLIATPAFATAWIAAVSASVAVQTVSEGLTIAFFAYLAYGILDDIFRKPLVDTESIFGALAVYLLMAYIFALVYSVIDMHVENAFNVPGRLTEAQLTDPTTGQGVFGYFSIVTLTTLGYGDVSPVSPSARSAVMLEAVLGQLYLVTMVARLVGMHVATGRHSKAG